jgi:polyhydroxyalkanoate synthesis regulator phasin
MEFDRQYKINKINYLKTKLNQEEITNVQSEVIKRVKDNKEEYEKKLNEFNPFEGEDFLKDTNLSKLKEILSTDQ